jgi:hypothetical protein
MPLKTILSEMLFIAALLWGCGNEESLTYVETAGRCSVRIEPATQAEQDALEQRFEERNSGLKVEHIDPYGFFITHAFFEGETPGDVIVLNEAEAMENAAQFVEANVDLLGMSEDDIAALQATAAYDSDTSRWEVISQGTKPIVGYEDLMPDGTNLKLRISIRDGIVVSMINRSGILPPFEICTDPGLSLYDSAVVHDVVGYNLYDCFKLFRGTVEEHHITDRKLIVYVNRPSDESAMFITLAYQLHVCMDCSLCWYFDVGPDTGSIINIEQLFVS